MTRPGCALLGSIEVFDLTEVQANYILEMPLRRLTKFSRIELETEREELSAVIEELSEVLDDEARLRSLVSDELGEVAKTFSTPRRTVLLESAGQPRTAELQLEVSDDPCWVLMSSTRLLARTVDDEPLAAGGSRAKHDVVVSAVRSSARGEVGVTTSAGRIKRLQVLDLPTVPATAKSPNLAGGAPLAEFVSLQPGEQVVSLVSLDGDGPELALELHTVW